MNGQTDQINGKRHQQVNPRGGIANHSIPKVRLRLSIVRDVRPGLAAGEIAGKSAPDADGGYNRQPDPVAAIRAMRVKVRGEVARENPEDPYPDRDVEHPVVVFVSLTFNDFFHE